MPAFAPDAQRVTYTIQEVPVTIPSIFEVGHVLTAPEAAFMNARLASIMVNAFGGDIRRAMDSATKARRAENPDAKEATAKSLKWDFQARLDEKFTDYKVGETNRVAAQSADPVEKVAREIAIREVKAQLAKKGIKVKPLMEAKHAEHGNELGRIAHERLNGAHKDRIYALARAQVESVSDDDDDLGLEAAA